MTMNDFTPRLNMLICYDERSTHINTVKEHIECFRRYTNHNVYYLPATKFVGQPLSSSKDPAAHIDLSVFDVIIVHYSVRLCFSDFINPYLAEKLAAYDGVKLLFIQDEYEHTECARGWMDTIRFSLIYTCVPDAYRAIVYPDARYPHTRFKQTLTGYVPEGSALDGFVTPMEERPLHIAYRGRILHPFYGKLGYEKYDIGVQMKRYAAEAGIPSDIEVDDTMRIYGDDWYRFLASSRATLGSESGANVFDYNGDIRAAIDNYMRDNPNAGFEQVYTLLVEKHDGHVKMNQVSPKIFEAIRLRTVLVLFEGEYSGVVKPDIHYIPLKKDYSNLPEVWKKLGDIEYLKHMAQRAYDDVIGSGIYSYRTFVESVDADIKALGAFTPRAEIFAAPIAANVNGAIRMMVPATVKGFVLTSGILGGAMQREAFSGMLSTEFRPMLQAFIAADYWSVRNRMKRWLVRYGFHAPMSMTYAVVGKHVTQKVKAAKAQEKLPFTVRVMKAAFKVLPMRYRQLVYDYMMQRSAM